MAPEASFVADWRQRWFADRMCGHWKSEGGGSVQVRRLHSGSLFEAAGKPDDGVLVAEIFPSMYHPGCHQFLEIKRHAKGKALASAPYSDWRCGGAFLRSANFSSTEAVNWRVEWEKPGSRRTIWSRPRQWKLECAPLGGVYKIPFVTSELDEISPHLQAQKKDISECDAFPWRLCKDAGDCPQDAGDGLAWTPWGAAQQDVLLDASRIATLLDIRHLVGADNETQERLTHLLMDHDLDYKRRPGLTAHPGQDYLVPAADSPLWATLPITQQTRKDIGSRIRRMPAEVGTHIISWSSENEVRIGRHRIPCSSSDISILRRRWIFGPWDPRRDAEVARLLALYHVFQNPLSHVQSGLHLGVEPAIRKQCEFELFASPLNAMLPNGKFASKWPHIEWQFGSVGTYPAVLSQLSSNTILCVNPPFTLGYITDVILRLQKMKSEFRLHIAMPIKQVPFKRELYALLPGATDLSKFVDSGGNEMELKHPTLYWRDERCDSKKGDQFKSPSSPALNQDWLPRHDDSSKSSSAVLHDAKALSASSTLSTTASTLSVTATSSGSPLSSPRWSSEESSLQKGCSINKAGMSATAKKLPVLLGSPSNTPKAGQAAAARGAKFACFAPNKPPAQKKEFDGHSNVARTAPPAPSLTPPPGLSLTPPPGLSLQPPETGSKLPKWLSRQAPETPSGLPKPDTADARHRRMCLERAKGAFAFQ
mmetsp:Transcript_48449/g.85419  ORF Transcript_48449/g.85419 Transcript_48449/m.85419 type:complete len:708 (-) Transcript_48449:56-2179(-)